MIDEHRYKLDRRKFVHGFWTKGRLIAVSVAALIMYVLNVVAIVLAIRGRS